jgi:hypothetical protein
MPSARVSLQRVSFVEHGGDDMSRTVHNIMSHRDKTLCTVREGSHLPHSTLHHVTQGQDVAYCAGGKSPSTQHTASCHTGTRRSVLCGRDVTFHTVHCIMSHGQDVAYCAGGKSPSTQYTTSCHTGTRRSVLCGREVTFHTVHYQ